MVSSNYKLEYSDYIFVYSYISKSFKRCHPVAKPDVIVYPRMTCWLSSTCHPVMLVDTPSSHTHVIQA